MYAYHSLPRIYLEHFRDHENKQWVGDSKQQNEDDFITSTHLNPALQRYGLVTLDGSKIEGKEIEKKETITNLFGSTSNFQQLLMHPHDVEKITSPAKPKVLINSNIAPQLGLKNNIE